MSLLPVLCRLLQRTSCPVQVSWAWCVGISHFSSTCSGGGLAHFLDRNGPFGNFWAQFEQSLKMGAFFHGLGALFLGSTKHQSFKRRKNRKHSMDRRKYMLLKHGYIGTCFLPKDKCTLQNSSFFKMLLPSFLDCVFCHSLEAKNKKMSPGSPVSILGEPKWAPGPI